MSERIVYCQIGPGKSLPWFSSDGRARKWNAESGKMDGKQSYHPVLRAFVAVIVAELLHGRERASAASKNPEERRRDSGPWQLAPRYIVSDG